MPLKEYNLFDGVKVRQGNNRNNVFIMLDLNKYKIPESNEIGFELTKNDMKYIIENFNL